jgi:hypothetical protein
MFIFTTHTAYNGEIGVVESGEVYEVKTSKKLHKEVHCGAIYYRSISGKKRYSEKKIEQTKVNQRVPIRSIVFKIQ